MPANRLKDGSPRKPSPRKLENAVNSARRFFAGNAGFDTSHGLIADEIIGPLLWAHDRLTKDNERLRRDVQQLMGRT